MHSKPILPIFLILLLSLLLAGCDSGTPAVTAIPTPLAFVPTPSLTASTSTTTTPSATATVTLTGTPTLSPTITETATITPTASITPSPTFAFPSVEVHTQAHCRYGPSSAYLHAADLYPGDTGSVRGRFAYSAWLHVKFDKLAYFCWVSPSVVDVSGDITTVWFTQPDLQRIGSNQYGPPQNVRAGRDGDQVTIRWDPMAMTEDKDRGYFIEAWVCQDGAYRWWTVSFPDQYTTQYTVADQPGCSTPSRGEIYTVEKHGYSPPASIPWP